MQAYKLQNAKMAHKSPPNQIYSTIKINFISLGLARIEFRKKLIKQNRSDIADELNDYSN